MNKIFPFYESLLLFDLYYFDFSGNMAEGKHKPMQIITKKNKWSSTSNTKYGKKKLLKSMIFFLLDPLSGLLPHSNGSQMYTPHKIPPTMRQLFVQTPPMDSNASFKKYG